MFTTLIALLKGDEMKALVFDGIGNIALKNVKAPVLKHQTDAIIKITTSTICGTDLHFVRGTIQGMKKGTILGHEGVGIIEKIGSKVRNFKVGGRVIVPSTIGCGKCPHCLEEHYALCDNANSHGHEAGTAFYGGPASSGHLMGLQAEKVRVPLADVNLVKIPDELSDDQVILLSDILPTSYMAVEMANISPTDMLYLAADRLAN